MLKILTENGFRKFEGVLFQGIPESLVIVEFEDGGAPLKSTKDHLVMMDNGQWLEAEDLEEGYILFGGRKVKWVTEISNDSEEEVFDIFDVEETNSYYSNGVISHNCNLIYLDELGFVESGVAQEFLASSYPVIFTGKKAKILISSTPLGMNHFYHLWKDAEAGKNGFLPIKVHYTENPNRDEAWAKEQLKLLGSRAFNQEVLCSFLGSAYTLISGDALQSLSSIDPIKEKGSLTIYEHPVPDHTYTVTVDTAEGIQQDRSAFSVIDITQRPYKIVARYYNDSISYLLFPDVIRQVAYDYNQAYVLVETNSVGNQVAVILMNDLEYDNVLRFISEPKKGQILSRDARAKYGIVMSSKVKSIGCRALKTLIEEDMLIINDAEIINELNNFVEIGTTYKAADGYHDDLVMTLVSFAYLTQDKRFLDFTDTSRNIEFKRQIERLSDEVKIPVTFYFDNGEETEIEDVDELVGF